MKPENCAYCGGLQDLPFECNYCKDPYKICLLSAIIVKILFVQNIVCLKNIDVLNLHRLEQNGLEKEELFVMVTKINLIFLEKYLEGSKINLIN